MGKRALVAQIGLVCAVAGCAGASGPGPAVPAPDDPADATPVPAAPAARPATIESAWIDSAVAAIRVDHGEAGGMRGCTGTLTPEAKSYFASVYREALKCFADAHAKGSISFHSTVEKGGGVSEFAVQEDKLGEPKLVECIQGKVFTVDFPKVDPNTPCVQLVHPLKAP